LVESGLNLLHRDALDLNCFHYAILRGSSGLQSYILGPVLDQVLKKHPVHQVLDPGKNGKSALHMIASESIRARSGKLQELFKPEMLVDKLKLDVNGRDAKVRT